MGDSSKQSSSFVEKDAQKLIEKIHERLTERQNKAGLLIVLQYPFNLDENILKEGRHTVFGKSNPYEILVFHTKDKETIDYLLQKEWIKPYKNFTGKKDNSPKETRIIYISPDETFRAFIKAEDVKKKIFPKNR
jgi:hypothetical protein